MTLSNGGFFFIAAILIGAVPTPLLGQTTVDPDASDAAVALGFDSRSGPLVFDGQPRLSEGSVRKRAVLVTVDVHWRIAGRLAETVAADNLRLEAGALLFRSSFHASGLSGDTLPAWCGGGQAGLVRRKYTVCIVETPDGRARLADGFVAPTDIQGPIPRIFVSEAPDWYVAAIHTEDKTTAIARPQIEPTDSSQLPPLRITIVYGGPLKAGPDLPVYMGLRSDPRSHRYMRQLASGADASGARIPFGRYDLVLTTADQGVQGHWESARRPSVQSAVVPKPGRPKPTPFVIDGALINPHDLTVASSVVRPGDDILEGLATHWATAKAVAVGSVLFATFRTPENAVFHKVETVRVDGMGARSITQAWCGQMGVLGLNRPFCAEIEADGHISGTAMSAGGRPWMAQELPPSQQQAGPAALKQWNLSPSVPDLLGPMTFLLRLQSADKNLVVQAQVRQGEDTITLWRGSVPFDQDGIARLPFWSHQLEATKAPGGVTVQLTPTGDGASPLEIESIGRH